MPLFLLDPRTKVAGSSLENVAEEVLNGLFCHYEPPVSEYAQHKAANEVRANPNKYTHSQEIKKQKKSILRTSRFFRKKKQQQQKPKGVTWRDEQSRANMQVGFIEACAADQCTALGVSPDGEGLADSLSPNKGATKAVTMENPFRGPIDSEPEKPEPAKEEAVPPKKVLYDDEGNPIIEGAEADENSPAAANKIGGVPTEIRKDINAPPPPAGLSQLRKLASELDVYEPENYDHPVSRSRKSKLPPAKRHAPRYMSEEANLDETESEYMERIGARSPHHPSRQSSRRNRKDDYDEEDEYNGGINKYHRRPGTPYRSRAEEAAYESDDNRRVGRPSSRRYERMDDGEYDSRSRRDARYSDRSHSPRSDVYSDLTEDVYGREGQRSRYPPQSPGMRSSEGVEVDIYKGRVRPRSRSPGRYKTDAYRSPAERSSRRSNRDYESDRRRSRDHFDYEDADHSRDGRSRRSSRKDEGDERRASRDHYEDSTRRGSRRDNDYDESSNRRYEEEKDSRRHQSSKGHSQDGGDYREAPRSDDGLSLDSLKYELDSINTDELKRPRYSTGEIDTDDGSRDRPRSSRSRRVSEPLPESGSHDSDSAERPAKNRDPTPRKSRGPLDDDSEQKRNEPLPPTPKRHDRDNRSKQGFPERKSSRGGSHEEERDAETAREGSEAGSRPQPLNVNSEGSMFDKAYAKFVNQFSPTSHATDDEIREEVSSVGMESNTLRPFQYANPFLQVPPPVMEDQERDDHSGEAETDQDPSTLSSPRVTRSNSSDDNKTKRKQKQSSKKKASSAPVAQQRFSAHDQGKLSSAPDIVQSSSNGSGSTKSKKLWRGWRNALGKVRSIVQDIDEKRIPPPAMPAIEKKSSKGSSKKSKKASSR